MNTIGLIFFILFLFLILLFIIYNIYFRTSKKNECISPCRMYGCCSDKITPKLDEDGSNCRGF